MSSNVDFAFTAPGAEGFNANHPAAAHIQIKDAATGELYWPEDRKKIAICGFASSSRHRIPVNDPNFVIVGLNQLYRHLPRTDIHFDVHREWRKGNVEGTDHERWIRECGIPVYLVQHEPHLSTTLTFPIDRLMRKHGGLDYFTSTVAHELCWAIDIIDREVTRRAGGSLDAATVGAVKALYGEYTIGIYGIDLVVGTEYDWQKACVEFWIGEASGRGINVDIAPESALCKQQYRYGYQMEPETLVKLGELDQRAAALEARKSKLIAEIQTLDGAWQENRHVRTVTELRLRGAQIPLGDAA